MGLTTAFADETGASAQIDPKWAPWNDAGRRVGSLLEMLEAYAANFAESVIALRDIEGVISRISGEVVHWPSLRVRIRNLDACLIQIRTTCESLHLDAALRKLERINEKLHHGTDASEAKALFFEMRERIHDDLKSRKFFYVAGTDADLYLNPEPFGAEVSKRLPRTLDDIREASKCLALGRGTACVFHLMRVMEFSVRVFAKKKVGIDPAPYKSWGPLISKLYAELNNKRKQNPSQKQIERLDLYTSLVANLDGVRASWRNPVMHSVEEKYTPEEAREVYVHVRTFVQGLAKLPRS